MEEVDLLKYYNSLKRKIIEHGAYANVYKYKDEFYNTYFAIKKLKLVNDISNIIIKDIDRYCHICLH